MTATHNLSIYASTSVTFIVSVLHYIMSAAANRLAHTFAESGAALPRLTQFLIQDSMYYWIFPCLMALVFVAHHVNRLPRRITLLITTVGTMISIALCVIGLYLPLFQLGRLVQP